MVNETSNDSRSQALLGNALAPTTLVPKLCLGTHLRREALLPTEGVLCRLAARRYAALVPSSCLVTGLSSKLQLPNPAYANQAPNPRVIRSFSSSCLRTLERVS